MAALDEFLQYMDMLCERLGHVDRRVGIHGIQSRSDAAERTKECRTAGGAY